LELAARVALSVAVSPSARPQ